MADMDNIETEGSAERAASRGANLFTPPVAEQSLSDPETVESLVRSMFHAALDVHRDYHEDREPDAPAALLKVVRRYEAIFTGHDQEHPGFPWPSEASFDAWLEAKGVQLDNSGENLSRCGVALLKGCADLIALTDRAADGELTDEQGQFETDVLVEDLTALLMGVDNSAD